MSFYPSKVTRRSTEHARAGVAEDANAEGAGASFACGAFARVSLRIDGNTNKIEAARYTTNGCGFMTAAADALCEQLTGQNLMELHGLPEAELTDQVAAKLGRFPTGRVQCAGVVFDALRAALGKYRASLIEEFQGEKALICTCFGVTEETLTGEISARGLTDVEDVAKLTKAGSGCGSCRMLIQELIDAGPLD